MIFGLAWAVGCMKVELHWGGTCIWGQMDLHRLPRLRASTSLFCRVRMRVAVRCRMVVRRWCVARLVVSMDHWYPCILTTGSQLALVLPWGGWQSLLAKRAFWAREGGVGMLEEGLFQG